MGQINVDVRNGIAIITIETPGRKNAFTRAMRGEIAARLDAMAEDAAVAGAVLTGAGDDFCAGQDLTEAQNWDGDVPWVEEFETFARSILKFPKPLIAAINGVAAGGGFQAALLCDVRVGSATAVMGQPEVKVGLASVTGTWLLQRAVGELRGRELALSGRMLQADALLQLGILSEVVPQDRVLDRSIELCKDIASSPAHAIARTKAWMYESVSDEIGRVFADASRVHRLGFEKGLSQQGAKEFLAR